MSFEDAVRLLLVSFDSTLKANLSVGLPFDLLIYDNDALDAGRASRIEADDRYFADLSTRWGEALKDTFSSLPPFAF